MKEVIKEVSKYYGLWEEQIKAKTRKREIVKPRQIAMYLIHKFSTYPLQQIGSIFNLNHATVIHAIKSVRNDIQTDKDFKKEVDDLIAILQQNHPYLFKKKTIPFKAKFFCNPVKYEL